MRMRTLPARTIIGLAITAAAALGADNTIGTWKLNMAQSKFTPGPSPVMSLTITREASDGGVKVTVTGERADGTPADSSYSAKYDGQDVMVAGNAPYDTISVKQVNVNTLFDERKKTGTKYRASGRTAISNGGKTMTVTIKGTDAEGKAFTNVMVYDKQ
jgi:2',3'-cyclic-nucleotide 2'-phosphodiesterase (5'-nucleotidase family)